MMDSGYTVTFPDLPGCITEGDTEGEVVVHATEALALHLRGMERDHEAIPEPSPRRDIVLAPGQAIVLVRANLRLFRRTMRERAVRKMVTVPRWLHDAAEKAEVNYSQVLQEGLKALLDVNMPEQELKRHAG